MPPTSWHPLQPLVEMLPFPQLQGKGITVCTLRVCFVSSPPPTPPTQQSIFEFHQVVGCSIISFSSSPWSIFMGGGSQFLYPHYYSWTFGWFPASDCYERSHSCFLWPFALIFLGINLRVELLDERTDACPTLPRVPECLPQAAALFLSSTSSSGVHFLHVLPAVL